MILGIVANVGLLISWALFLLYILRRKGVSLLIGASSGILGIFALLFLIRIILFGELGITFSEWTDKIIVGPVLEECSKLSVILVLMFIGMRREKSKTDSLGPDVGPAVGLGFAFLENFGHAANVQTVLLRGGPGWILHVGTAALLSYHIVFLMRTNRSFVWTILILLSTILIHSGFNAIVLVLGFG